MYLYSLNPAEQNICEKAGSFLQSNFWGAFKARFGWKALAFNAVVNAPSADGPPADAPQAQGEIFRAEVSLLVLHRRLGPGISFAYVPWGPELPPDCRVNARSETAAEIALLLRKFLPPDTAFIRFDFPWYTEEIDGTTGTAGTAGTGETVRRPFVKAAVEVQPPDSVLVDLQPEEAAILGAMKAKWRYNVGLAEKKGVVVRKAVSSLNGGLDRLMGELEKFYGIYKETAARDGISIHNIEYYAALFETAAAYGVDTRLYLASHEGEDIAGIVTLYRGLEAVYLYGASANHKRNLMAPYALQWQAMRDAKAAGCGFYDLYGIPPVSPETDPNHPMAGLYRFKTGFIGENGAGGKIIHRPGSWDYSFRPLAKALYSAAEKTRKKMWDIKKKHKRR